MTATVIRFQDFIVKEADPRNWTLERDTGRPAKTKDGTPTGETILEFVGYYANPEEAFRSAVRQGLKGQGLSGPHTEARGDLYAQANLRLPPQSAALKRWAKRMPAS